jgi:hypothetical protein
MIREEKCAESIEQFIEYRLPRRRMIWLLPQPPPLPPLPSTNCLSFSDILCVATRQSSLLTGGGSHIIRRRGRLVHYKSLNTLWKKIVRVGGRGEDDINLSKSSAALNCRRNGAMARENAQHLTAQALTEFSAINGVSILQYHREMFNVLQRSK